MGKIADKLFEDQMKRKPIAESILDAITALEDHPKQMIVYPYPPTLEIDGVLYETLDYITLVKLVYDLRNRVNELEERMNNV